MTEFDEVARTTGFRPAEVTGVIGSVWTDPDAARAAEWVAAWDEAYLLHAHEGDGCSMDPLTLFAKSDVLLEVADRSTPAGFERLRARWMATFAAGRSAEAGMTMLDRLAVEDIHLSGSLTESPAERAAKAVEEFAAAARTTVREDHVIDAPRYARMTTEAKDGIVPDEANAEQRIEEDEVERSDEWSLFDEMHNRLEGYRIDLRSALERGDRLEAELAATRRTSWKYLRDVACVAIGAFGVVLVTALAVLPGWS